MFEKARTAVITCKTIVLIIENTKKTQNLEKDVNEAYSWSFARYQSQDENFEPVHFVTIERH